MTMRAHRPWELDVGSRSTDQDDAAHSYAVKMPKQTFPPGIDGGGPQSAPVDSHQALPSAASLLSSNSNVATVGSPNSAGAAAKARPPTKRLRTEDEAVLAIEARQLRWSPNTGSNVYTDYARRYVARCKEEHDAMREQILQIGFEIGEHEVLVHGRRVSTNSMQNLASAHLPLDLALTTLRLRLKESNLALQTLLNSGLSKSSNPHRRGSSRSSTAKPSADVSDTPDIGASETIFTRHPHSGSNSIALTGAANPDALQHVSHQLSEKTQAHASLLREHNVHLTKFGKLQSQLAAIERKYEAIEAENISLATDKERLLDRVQNLETHEQELQQQCEEARIASENSKAQWMRMLSMAGKLQDNRKDVPVSNGNSNASNCGSCRSRSSSRTAVSADDEGETNKWEMERASLLARIATFERTTSNAETDGPSNATITRLEARNKKLEEALEGAKAAALTLAVHGQNVGAVLKKALSHE